MLFDSVSCPITQEIKRRRTAAKNSTDGEGVSERIQDGMSNESSEPSLFPLHSTPSYISLSLRSKPRSNDKPGVHTSNVSKSVSSSGNQDSSSARKGQVEEKKR